MNVLWAEAQNDKFLTPFPRRAHGSRGLLAMADASDALVRVYVMYG